VLDGVERTLRAEFMSNLARSTRRDAHEMMAEIFNNLDRKAEGRFIAGAGGTQPRGGGAHQGADVHLRRFAAAVRAPAMQVLLRSVDKEKLPLALKGASENCATCSSRAVGARGQDAARRYRGAGAGESCAMWTTRRPPSWLMAKGTSGSGEIELGGGKDEEMVY
jgi:flagellar motor switch protein FliG